jgi:hypothetical protein
MIVPIKVMNAINPPSEEVISMSFQSCFQGAAQVVDAERAGT